MATLLEIFRHIFEKERWNFRYNSSLELEEAESFPTLRVGYDRHLKSDFHSFPSKFNNLILLNLIGLIVILKVGNKFVPFQESGVAYVLDYFDVYW